MNAPRNDKANLAILESKKAEFDRLRDEKIRNESAMDRNKQELLAAEKEAQEKFGTSNVDELRGQVEEIYAANTTATDEFSNLLSDIGRRLAEVDAAPSAEQTASPGEPRRVSPFAKRPEA